MVQSTAKPQTQGTMGQTQTTGVKFFTMRTPNIQSRLSNNKFVISQVERKLHKASKNYNKIDEIVEKTIKKEDRKMQKRLQ